MSQVYCWECEESYARDEVLDIPVFDKGHTIKWCLNCMMKQLQWTDYRLIPEPKKYKPFKVQSVEDWVEEFNKILDEIWLCYEVQYGKVKDNTELFRITDEIMHETWDEVRYKEVDDDGDV